MIRFFHILCCITLIVVSFTARAQEVNFKLDYSATYLLHKSMDTVEIRIGEGGKYIFTESQKLASLMAKDIAKSMKIPEDELENMSLLLNMQTAEIFIKLQGGHFALNGMMNLELFMPKPLKKEEINLVADATDDRFEWKGNNFMLYHVYPKTEPKETLKVAFWKEFPFDYQSNISKLFSMIFGSDPQISLPEGLIVYAEDPRGNPMIQLLDVRSEPQKGHVNMNINLEE